MKRILLTSVICMFAIIMNAQINRTIFGIQLGASGASAKKVLQDKGLKVESGETELGYTIAALKPIFSGVQWDAVVVTINEGKVYSVLFSKDGYDFDSNHPIQNESKKITDALNTKYGDFSIDPASQGLNPDATVFQDDKTRLVLFYTIPSYSKEQLLLIYIDFEGAEKRNEAILDEL